jgi:hypothetical protein
LKVGEGYAANYVPSTLGPEETVAFLASNPDALAYIGYAYYYEHGIELYAAAIQNQNGTYVTPGADSVVDGSYNPLSRRIYMNLLDDAGSLANTVPFALYGFSTDGTDLVTTTGYVPIPNPSEMLARLPGSNTTTTTGTGSGSSSSAKSAATPKAAASMGVLALSSAIMYLVTLVA